MGELYFFIMTLIKGFLAFTCGALWALGGGINIGGKDYGWKPARGVLIPIVIPLGLFLTAHFNWWILLMIPAYWGVLTISYGESSPLTKWFGKTLARLICGLAWALPAIWFAINMYFWGVVTF